MARATRDLNLEGEVAVVTGASGRLGPVWIDALASAGAMVVGLDVMEAEHPAAARTVTADVTDRPAVEAAIGAVEREVGPIAILVNNAGVDAPPGGAGEESVEDVQLPEFLRVLEVNLAGAFAVAQACGPSMAKRGCGSIVNIGSLYAVIAPIPEMYDHLDPPFLKPPAYGASKAGLLSLTRYLARLWGPRGVRVNMLSPGGVEGGQDPEFRRRFQARVPLGRLAGPADLAGALLFLVSEQSRYVTGQNLVVDGGFTA
jgi:NAD(P)-dependent dehydrogenase (short-subunit alcohol dehydrogenase family)